MTSVQQEQTKRRIENAISSLMPKRQRLSAATSKLQASKNNKSAATVAFRPWNHEDLLQRISTFKVHTWLIGSPLLSPVKCARNGWVNEDCSTLKCLLCSAILIAQLPDDLTDDEQTKWIERLVELLQISHKTDCPWKGRECLASVYSVPLATSTEMVDGVCSYAADLLVQHTCLPMLTDSLTSFQSKLLSELKQKTVQVYRDKDSLGSPDSGFSEKEVHSALVLALYGWRIDRSMSRPTIKCELCFRSAGLWLFSNTTDGASNKHMFDVVGEHRSFCYWAHGSGSEEPSGSIPGWQKTIASILRAKTISGNNEKDDESSSISISSGSEDTDSDNDNGSDVVVGSATLKGLGLRPFNISAISSAAEAFGIPFSSLLLSKAMKRMKSSTSASQPDGSRATTSSAPATTQDDNNSTQLEPADVEQPPSAVFDTYAELPPSSINIGDLASMLGDSKLASALEDPIKARAILEYVKGLLKAKNQAAGTG